MRREIREVIVAWIIGFLTLAAAALASGCAHDWEPTAPSTVNETMVLSETERFSKLMGVHVVGHMTNDPYYIGQLYATGWYVGQNGKGAVGDAYYYVPAIRGLRPAVSDAPESVVNVAAHECCHALTGQAHDVAHWECMEEFATPTYPRPK